MAEYKFDEDSVKALIDWAKSTSFPQSVTLSDAENIVDVKRFVQANLSDIDAHYPDDFYNPNINTITPILAHSVIKSVWDKMPKQAGPKISPANNAPTTCGI